MELVDELLVGAVDIHVHNMMMKGYRWNLVDLANKAIESQMKAIVLKNFYGSSSEMAYFVNHFVGKEVFVGSIVLNRWVGGLNPVAVEDSMNYGNGIKIVSMPTRHALNHLKLSKGNMNNAVQLFDGNEILPELAEIMKIIAKNDLVLATGHISPEESLRLIEAARNMGVKKIVVTHASAIPVMASLDHQKEMAKKGALIEQCMASCMPFHSIKMKQRFGMDVNYNTEKIIRHLVEVGIERCVISSDFGQEHNPYSVDGIRLFVRALLDSKLTSEQIRILVRDNPRKLLGMQEN